MWQLITGSCLQIVCQKEVIEEGGSDRENGGGVG